VGHEPPEQLPDEEDDVKPPFSELDFNPTGAKTLTISELPHLSHFILLPLSLLMTFSLITPHLLHL
jgi:hypothetical protein